MAHDDGLDTLSGALPAFFNQPSLADGLVKCVGKEFKIHRLVLCAQSKFFLNGFTGKWKESNGLVTLEHDDPCIVEAMLQFMYSFDYDSSGRGKDSCSPMVFNAKVYSIAEKYDVPALKSLAKQKFERTAEVCWDMDDFPDAVAQVYHSTLDVDCGLREVVVNVACKHIDRLLSKDVFCDVLQETMGFASGVVQRLAEKQQSAKKFYRCPNCCGQWEAVLPTETSRFCMFCGDQRSDWASFQV